MRAQAGHAQRFVGRVSAAASRHVGRDWTAAFTQAYEDLRGRIERDEETPIDDYAAESPAECFAVFSEYFFEAPHILRAAYPAVYEQLVRFYRQDPAARLGQVKGVRLD